MKYFKIRVNIDNKLWTNFYSFSHHFFCKDREITFVDEKGGIRIESLE